MRYSNLLILPKLYWGFILLACFLCACNSASNKRVESLPVSPKYDAGKLKPADTLIKHTFYIKSTGNTDLKIDSVVTSCDCVTLDWQKTPIAPGKTGFIHIAVKPNFDVKGKMLKYVMVRTNSTTPLTIFQIFFTL